MLFQKGDKCRKRSQGDSDFRVSFRLQKGVWAEEVDVDLV